AVNDRVDMTVPAGGDKPDNTESRVLYRGTMADTDYLDLAVFAAVARTKNVHRAAQEQRVSTSSLSQRLGEPEERLGVCRVNAFAPPRDEVITCGAPSDPHGETHQWTPRMHPSWLFDNWIGTSSHRHPGFRQDGATCHPKRKWPDEPGHRN